MMLSSSSRKLWASVYAGIATSSQSRLDAALDSLALEVMQRLAVEPDMAQVQRLQGAYAVLRDLRVVVSSPSKDNPA